MFFFNKKAENLAQAPEYWLIVLEENCLLRIFLVAWLNPKSINFFLLTSENDSEGSAIAGSSWGGGFGEGGGAEDVLGWGSGSGSGNSGGGGIGISTMPTSNSRKTSFFFPFFHPSFEKGNMNLEASTLALPLRPFGPKQGHSGKGLLVEPSLGTSSIWAGGHVG